MTDPTDLQGLSPADPSPPPRQEGSRPMGLLWIHYLFFRPRRFFPHFVRELNAPLAAACAWTYGMSGAIDQIDWRLAAGTPVLVADTWSHYWIRVALTGIIGGFIYYKIGGWWYRMRLAWSGARDPDAALARRVYLFASQVIALPALLVAGSFARAYPTPLAAAQSDGTGWEMLLVVFPFWSAWAG